VLLQSSAVTSALNEEDEEEEDEEDEEKDFPGILTAKEC
jgi:hypothetical protein